MKLYQWFLAVMASFLAVITPKVAMAAIDVSEVVKEIGSAKEPMISVGSAVLGLVVVALLFMMVRRVMR